ncbi:hypothetical protein C1N53_00425 [Pontibacter sp. SGAir0037]|nr:hypothetical protein C1N53_00425 [Pontibacter sp. SGAir0037]
MLLTMVVSLYTVRVVLSALGSVDYGINNVVGSVVTMLAFLGNTMASASQRFFAFEIGQANYRRLNKIFNISFSIYILLALVAFILAETIGIWLLNNYINIPVDRVEAANWVYHFAILSFILTMITIPYNALIMAHEKMKFYAYVSIIEAFLKLIIVFVLSVIPYDKLKLYAVLTFLVTIVITAVYIAYSTKKFKESKFSIQWDFKLFQEIARYSGWSLFGATTSVLNNQGLNLILNIFFGPIINTARGIAYQVNAAITSFVNNLYSAVNPQIIKSYAENDIKRQTQLVINSTKIAYTLLFILSLPIIIKTEYILKLWLGNEVDPHMILFTRLVLLFSLVNVFESPISQAVRSTGKIKKYQLYVGMLTLSILPISYILLKLWSLPEVPFYVMIIVYTIAMFIRLQILNSLVVFPIKYYLINVFFKLLIVSLIVSVIPFSVSSFLGVNNFSAFIVVSISSFISVLFVFYFLMLASNERKSIHNYITIFLKQQFK